MKEKYLAEQKYFDISTNCICGVVVPEEIMRKAQKILLKAESEIKNLLHQNKDKCYISDWSLANVLDENGKILKQKTFYYSGFHTWGNVEQRINNLRFSTPRVLDDFYIVKNEKQVKEIQEDIYEELKAELLKGGAK